METATLHITAARAVLSCGWCVPGAEPLCRERSIHPDDLASLGRPPDTPPASTEALEAFGRRIFSRLLEREVREAVFASPPRLVTLETNLPEVPWEVAFGPGRFLADAHALGRGPAAKPSEPGERLRVLLVADPTGDLPYCASEAAEISQRLAHVGRVHIETLRGAAATRDALLSALESRAFDAFHYTGHADTDPENPARSSLRLHDGPLTAEDVYQAAMARPPALCVLNACESGRAGDGAAAGLANALRSAGAGAVVGTLWPVSNKSAAHAMACLYASLLSGDPVGRAVQSARAQARQAFSHDPMLTWAALTLHGSPETRLVREAGRVVLGRAPLAGRTHEWRALDAAWADARAGHFRAVVLAGRRGAGKTRLLEDWLASVPEAPIVRLDSRGAFPPQPGGPPEADGACILVCDGLEAAADPAREAVRSLAGQEGCLLVACSESASEAAWFPRDSVRVLPLGPLEGQDLLSVFTSLGADPPDAILRALPGEAERIALGRHADDTPGALSLALPEDERRVLRAGAVVGESFLAGDAAGLLDSDEGSLWGPLDRLCGAGWIVETEPGAFRFNDPRDRDAVLEAFRPEGERRSFYRKRAAQLEEEGRSREAGDRWRDAGETDAAARAWRDAFRRAAQDRDPAEVVACHERLQAAGRAPDEPWYARTLAWACMETGDADGARRAWERALEDEVEPAGRAGVMVRLAEARAALGESAHAEAGLREAERLTGTSAPRADALWAELLVARCRPSEALVRASSAMEGAPEPAVAARAALAGARASLLVPDPGRAVRWCERGLALGPADPVPLARTLVLARRYAGDEEAAEADLLRLCGEQGAGSRAHERGATMLALAELYRDQGRLDEALAMVDEALEIGERRRRPALVADALNLRCSVLRRHGRYTDALEAARRAEEAALPAGIETSAIHARILAATVLAEQGCFRDAREAGEDALRAAEADGYAYGVAWARVTLACLYLDAGDPARAREHLEPALKVARETGGHIGAANAWCFLGWAAWDEGAPEAGPFEEAERTAAAISYSAVRWPAAFGRALVADDMAASDAALREIEARNMGSLAAWLRARRGAHHLRAGRPDDAMVDLAFAYRVARRLGMRGLQAISARDLAGACDAVGDPMASGLREEAGVLQAECLSGF